MLVAKLDTILSLFRFGWVDFCCCPLNDLSVYAFIGNPYSQVSIYVFPNVSKWSQKISQFSLQMYKIWEMLELCSLLSMTPKHDCGQKKTNFKIFFFFFPPHQVQLSAAEQWQSWQTFLCLETLIFTSRPSVSSKFKRTSSRLLQQHIWHWTWSDQSKSARHRRHLLLQKRGDQRQLTQQLSFWTI